MLLQDIKDIKSGRIITNDNDIIINITTTPEEKNEIETIEETIYKEYTLKQDRETGEINVYSPGGTIVANCKTLELATAFIDGIAIK